jgi:hydrogenase maturation factor
MIFSPERQTLASSSALRIDEFNLVQLVLLKQHVITSKDNEALLKSGNIYGYIDNTHVYTIL